MFWDETVMGVGTSCASRVLGPQGRFSPVVKATHSGVALYTRLAGRFWYGDVDIYQEKNALQKIARAMKETLYVISGDVFDITNPKTVLLEVRPARS